MVQVGEPAPFSTSKAMFVVCIYLSLTSISSNKMGSETKRNV